MTDQSLPPAPPSDAELDDFRAWQAAGRPEPPQPGPPQSPSSPADSSGDDGPVVRARTDGNGTPLLDVPRKQVMTAAVGEEKEIPVWHPDHESKPPAGSTQESLLVLERGVPVRVAGPTHYHQLADGRVLGGYSGGTHYDDGAKITRIIGIHEG